MYSDALTKCGVDWYLWSPCGDCPASPAGAGCRGKWWDVDSNGDMQPNPGLRVVAASAGQQQG